MRVLVTLSLGLPTVVLASANEPTPSLEEMWKVIQQQQAEINNLKEQNAQLLKQVAVPQADGSAKTSEQASVAVAPATETEPAPPPVEESSGSTFDIYGAAMLDMGYQFK